MSWEFVAPASCGSTEVANRGEVEGFEGSARSDVSHKGGGWSMSTDLSFRRRRINVDVTKSKLTLESKSSGLELL